MTLSSRPTQPVPLTSKCQMRKIDVYNLRNFNKVFLSLTQVHKLVHKQIFYIASSAHITSMTFLVPTLVNYNLNYKAYEWVPDSLIQ